ncbi:MAG: hypothetical protein SFX72_16530 [Isosphaeraceae bacterium]|nr:hypothetical protein [Isosphaeraceae bacterium]
MMPELERLATLARRAEANAKAQKLEREAQLAVERLQVAEKRAKDANRRLVEEQPPQKRELDEVEKEEKLLAELIQKIALYKATLEDPSEAEQAILSARSKLDQRKRDAKAILDDIAKVVDEAERELATARERYQAIRKELDRLLPQLAEKYSEADRIIAEAELYLPSGQIKALLHEINEGSSHFSVLDSREQKAQLMIWIGKLRRLQLTNASRPAEEVQELESIFRRLVSISKQYMPGYIDAFQEGYTADWDVYIVEAQERLREATETVRRDRELRQKREEEALREQERRARLKEQAAVAIEDLRAVIASHDLPESGLDEFFAALAKVVSLNGAAEPELLQLIRPYREHINGSEFRAVRKNLDRLQEEDDKVVDDAAFRERFRKIIELTRGRRAVIIGGAVREDARKSLQKTFEFDELEWEAHESNRPAILKSLEQRVRNRGIDLLLILKEFVSHSIPGTFRPLCDDFEIPCLMVEKGYGASQVAEAIRTGLLKETLSEPAEAQPPNSLAR